MSTLRVRVERHFAEPLPTFFDDLSEADRLLQAALYTLRSYQHGNTAPALAEEVADEIERFLEPESGEEPR